MLNTLQKRWGNKRPEIGYGLNGHELTRGIVCCFLFNELGHHEHLQDIGPHKFIATFNTGMGPGFPLISSPPGIVDFGPALKLAGSPSILLGVRSPQDLSLFEIQDQTMSCWIRVPSGLPVESDVICSTMKSDGLDGYYYTAVIGATKWNITLNYYDSVAPGFFNLNGAANLNYDTWYLLTVTFNLVTGTMTWYFNGQLGGTLLTGNPNGAVAYAADQNFMIGSSVYTSLNSSIYLGSLMLWNRLLSKREIALLYQDPWCFVQQPNPLSIFLLGQESVQSEFAAALDQLQDTRPVTKVEFIDTAGNVTDISSYYQSGGSIEKIKDRAPNEIQSGNFDITLFNTDDNFSEYKATSLFYNLQYIGSKIRISHGFYTSDGTATYEIQMIGFIDQIAASQDNSFVTLRCRDRIRDILDKQIHTFPFSEVPVFNGANAGNGIISSIETLAFKTVTENWTLTCTLGGADGVATFSVIGSVSGNVGTATSGTQFSTGTGAGGIRFTINGGTINWVIGDIITFSTKGYPQWSALNPIKIIWSILTGYIWDSGVQESFSGLVLALDHSRDSSNTDIDYDSFVQAVADIDIAGTVVKGYGAYNESAYTVIGDLLLLVLGSIFTGPNGKIMIRTSVPKFSSSYRNFSDVKKVTRLGYNRSVDEVINHVTVNYKRKDSWQFSGDDPIFDSTYSSSDSASIAKYGTLGQSFNMRWYSSTAFHITDFAAKLLDKFSEPPLNIDFDTGLDALRTDIGDRISVTDTKYGFGTIQGEVAKITKLFDADPQKISLRLRRDGNTGLNWCFLGSSENENDGLSPQSSGWDTATDSDKLFAYLSQTATGGPDDHLF